MKPEGQSSEFCRFGFWSLKPDPHMVVLPLWHHLIYSTSLLMIPLIPAIILLALLGWDEGVPSALPDGIFVLILVGTVAGTLHFVANLISKYRYGSGGRLVLSYFYSRQSPTHFL